MTQQDFNDKNVKALGQLTETLSEMGKTRDAMYQLIQLESSRVDSAEDKLDILMGERYSRIANEAAEEDEECELEGAEYEQASERFFKLLAARNDFDTAIDEHLERNDKDDVIDAIIISLNRLR